MCGRVRLSTDYSEIKIRLKFYANYPAPNIPASWNVCPTVAPTRLLDREILLARRPATGGPRGMGRMHRVGEQHGLVVGQRVQDFFIVRDESLLLFLVELTRDDFRLVIFEPQAMQ